MHILTYEVGTLITLYCDRPATYCQNCQGMNHGTQICLITGPGKKQACSHIHCCQGKHGPFLTLVKDQCSKLAIMSRGCIQVLPGHM